MVNFKTTNMKKTFLLLVLLTCQIFAFSQVPHIENLKEKHFKTIDNILAVQQNREVITCIRNTDFVLENGISDTSFQEIIEVDVTNDYTTILVSNYNYNDAAGMLEFESEFIAYGVALNGSETIYDSLVINALDPVSGDKILFTKEINFFTPSGQYDYREIYTNLGFFGLPLGIVLDGIQQWYYDSNDFLIAKASKSVELGTMDLIPGDSTFYTNNAMGNFLIETSLGWESNQYVPNTRTTRTYAPDGIVVNSQQFETWNEVSGTWSYNSLNLYTYNPAGNVSLLEVQTGGPGNWKTVQEISVTYDGMNREIQRLNQQVDPMGVKSPIFRELTTYDTPQGWLSDVFEQDYINNQWVNTDRHISENCDNIGLPPFDPTMLVANKGTNFGSIDLTWTDNSDFETGYALERSDDNVIFVEIVELPLNTVTYTDAGLIEGNIYYYRVRGYNQAGYSDYSNIASSKPKSTSITSPESIGFMNAYFGSNGLLNLEIEAAVFPKNVKVYDIQGRQIYHASVHPGLNSLPVNTVLQRGVYMVQVEMVNGAIASRKVVF